MVCNAKILSPTESHALIKRYRQSNEFEVHQHEEIQIDEDFVSIKFIISQNSTNNEVRFIAKSKNKLEKEISALLLFNAFNCFDFVPKYYLTRADNLIIFEDFFEQGFVRPKLLELDHIKLVLKTLAKYHAGSIKLEEARSKQLGARYRIIDEYPEFAAKTWFKAKISEELNKIIEDCIKFGSQFRNVLCHGSLRNGNVLFKYNKNVPIECKFINFELPQYNPPAVDLLQFIYATTTQIFRKHHLHDLLHLYYDHFKNELDSADLISQEDFDVSINNFLPLIKLENAQHSGSMLELKDLLKHPGLTVEDIFVIVKNKIGTTNYDLLSYKLTSLDKISGYLGDHNKLKIDIVTNNEPRRLDMFVKFTPKSAAAIDLANDTNAFHKEIFFYQNFVPMMKNFGLDLIGECIVPCYFTRKNDVVIFDDIEKLDYKMLEPREPFSLDVMQIVIKKLAKFHACGMILEEKLCEKNKNKLRLVHQFPNVLKESLILQQENHYGSECILSAVNAVEHELKLFPNPSFPISDEELKPKIKKAFQLQYELVKPTVKFRNVLCHGDLWSSNVLVQLQNGKPIDCRLIDFQICRYCPPAQDLMSFMYLTTDRNVRKHHQVELIDLYYEELSKSLELYGYDIDELYPRDSFMKSIDYIVPQAVCQTVMYFHLGLTNSDVLKEHMVDEESTRNILLGDRRDYLTDMAKRDQLFRVRASESIQDLREMCVKYF